LLPVSPAGEKVAEGRMRDPLFVRDELTRVLLRLAAVVGRAAHVAQEALIFPSGTFSPAGEKGNKPWVRGG
jgi:hypothetical protein